MLLTNWLRSISQKFRPTRSRFIRHQRSRAFNRQQPALSRRPVGIEQLEDRTMLTSFISIDDVSEWEGDSWNIKTDFVFTVTRTGMNPGDLNQDLTIDFSTQDGTATLNDYLAQSGSVVFSAHATSTSQSKTIVVQVDRDSKVETDEFFQVVLSTNGGDVTFEKNIGTGTILEDDIMVLDQAGRILPPESATAGDRFGNVIAIDEDFMVVGAIESDLIAADAGAVFVYFRNRQNTPDNDFDDVWEYHTTLTAFDAAQDDHFGCSVDIDGDTIVIGAYQDNGREFRSGTAYVYRWDGNSWNFEDKLIASDGRFNDNFGGDVTIENDVIVVGASQKNPSIPDAPFYIGDAGQAYVFTRTGSDWSETQIITAPNQDTSDQFGWRVELENDTLFISGLKSDLQDSTADQGAIFVYHNINGTWTVQQTLVIPDGETNDLFGFDLDVDGDILGVISGSVNERRRNAYVFENVDGTWQYSFDLGTPGLLNSPSANSISVSGDSIAVGSYLSDGYRDETGIVNIYHRKPLDNYWIRSEEIYASYGYTDDYFGYAVAYSDSQLIIGIPQAPDSTRNAGQLYIFEPHRPEVSFELGFQGTKEDVSGQTEVRLYVTRESNRGVGALYFDSTIYYHTVDGTATVADGDYQEQSGSITFAGDSNAARQLEYITIYINDDNKFEGFEEFYIQLTDETGGSRFYFDRAEILIFDNDYANINVENVTVDEDAGFAMVDVTLDNAVDTNVSVDFSTSDVSAFESSDYTPINGTLVFEPGVLTKTIAIPLLDTDEIEGDETFALTLSNLQVSGALVQIGVNTGLITIKDDDEANISISDLTIDEGTGTASVVVALDQPVETTITVSYETADQSAKSEVDYLAQSGTLIFTPGEQTKTITIPLIDNSLLENQESFFVNLTNIDSNGANISFSDNQGLVTILDNDQASILFNNVSTNENEGTAILTVSLDQPLDTVISVDFATSDQTATDSSDYLAQTGTLTFNPGEQIKTITVPIVNNNAIEAAETFLINLTNLQANGTYVVILDNEAVVTIMDDDQAKISINDLTVVESDGTAVLTVSLDQPADTSVSVDFTTVDQSALDTNDFVQQSGTLVFNPGEQTKTITINIVDTDLVELDETFFVNLTDIHANGANIIFDKAQAEVTIQDDDQASLSISDLTVNENDGTAYVTVTLNQQVDTAVSINYVTANQTASSPDDYQSQSGMLTFNPGEQSKTIAIPIVNTDLVESDEMFFVNLSNLLAGGRNVLLTDNQAEVTILDDDQGKISINDVAVNEAAGIATITVSLDKPVATSISVDYATSNQTASDPEDYIVQTGTLTFNPGEQAKTITVSIINSDAVESDETFLINLTNLQANGANVVIADGDAEITILDDDQAKISINDLTVIESVGTAVLTVSLDQPAETIISVDFTTEDQSAFAPDDYFQQSGTIVFNPGEQTKTITIDIVDSDLLEPEETFFVNLTGIQSNEADVIFDDPQAQVTILDDDQAQLSVSDLTVNETDGTAYITVSIDKPINDTVSIDYTTIDQTSYNSIDYSFQTGTLTFNPGELTKTIMVDILDDAVVEVLETFLVKLSNLQTDSPDVILYDNEATITIQDDDFATFSIDDITVNENAGTATLKVSLNRAVYLTITVDYATAEASASNTIDYSGQSGTLTFYQGQRSRYITIPILDSDLVEGSETFQVNLSNIQSSSAQVNFADSQAVVTILDDEEAHLTINDVMVDESAGTVDITVSLDSPVEVSVSIDFATVDQTAIDANDYQTTSGTLTFNPGEQTKTITVPVVDSDLVELNETFLINLTNLQANGANIILGESQATVTITDNDQARILIDDVSVDENAGIVSLTVSLDSQVDSTVSIDFATADQTAATPDDYLMTSGTLTFNPGEQSKTITVAITDSDLLEPDETFLVNLFNLQANGRNVALADNQAQVTIFDDEIATAEIHYRVVNSPTNTTPNGEAGTLPENRNWVSEWSSYWVEIWINANNPTEQGVFSAALDFNYNTEYTSASAIEFGPAFTQNQAGYLNDITGTVEGLYAETTVSGLGINNQILFARIKFEPNAEDQVSLDLEGKSIGPYDLGLGISSQQVILEGDVSATTGVGTVNRTSIYANPLDFNDDDEINFRDLIIFAGVYNTTPSQSSSDYSWFADFNQSHEVNFRDLILFASNYGKSKLSHLPVSYPANYPDVWNDLLRVEAQPEPQSTPQSITQSTAETALESVIDQISPVLSFNENETLQNIEIRVVDLEGDTLGRAAAGTIYIDVNASGHGWFVDTTLNDHSEFAWSSELTLIALPGSEAENHIDLRTVILHEIGHILGYEHKDEGVMQDSLDPSVRNLPTWGEDLDDFFSDLTKDLNMTAF